MTLAARIGPLQSRLPQVEFHWDFETEILTARLSIVGPTRASEARTIELGDEGGAFVTLGLDGDIVTGLEVVVWPKCAVSGELAPPPTERRGRMEVQLDEAAWEAGVVDLTVELSCEKNDGGSTIHIGVGDPRQSDCVILAENLWAEVDRSDWLAGFWLLGVPPFPSAARHR